MNIKNTVMKNQRSLISIIIPIYNAEKYLKKCLDSILANQYNEWECILVDDGSKDASLSICNQYAEKDSRFKVYHQENAGASAARNIGLNKVKGEYITFIDADDWVSPNYLSAIEKTSSDIILLETKHVNPLGEIIRYFSLDPQMSSSREEYVSILEEILMNPIMKMMTAKIVRRSCIGNIQFDVNMKIGEDTLFWYDVLRNCNSIQTLNGYTYFWRDNGGDVAKYPLTPEEAGDHASKIYQSYKQLGIKCDEVEIFIVDFYFSLCCRKGIGLYLKPWFENSDVRSMNKYLIHKYPNKLSDYYKFYLKPLYIQYFLLLKYRLGCIFKKFILHR